MAKTVAARGERPASSTAGTLSYAGGTQATRRTLKTRERDPHTDAYRQGRLQRLSLRTRCTGGVEQALYLRTGCDDGTTRPVNVPNLTGHTT